MNTKATVRQLAAETGTDPQFLLRKLKEAGLPHSKLDDSIEPQDKDKMRGVLSRPKKTLKRTTLHSNTPPTIDFVKKQNPAPQQGARDNDKKSAYRSGSDRGGGTTGITGDREYSKPYRSPERSYTTGSRPVQGQGGRPGYGQGYGQRSGQGQGDRPGYGQRSGQGEGQRSGQGYGQRSGQGEGQRSGQGYGQRSGQGQGDRPGYGQRSGQGQGDRPGYGQRSGQGQGDRPGYGQRTGQGDRPGYGQRSGQGEGQRSGQGYGQRSGQGQGDRPGYGQRSGQGDRPGYGQRSGQGDRPGYGQRTGQGDRPGYGQRSGQGDRPGYGQRTGQGDRPGYGQRTGQGDRPGYGQRTGQGDRPGYGQRTGQGDRPGYGQRSGQGDRPGYGQRTGQGDRPGYGQRTGQGDRPGYGQRTGQGQGGSGYGQRTGQGQGGTGYSQRTGQGQGGAGRTYSSPNKDGSRYSQGAGANKSPGKSFSNNKPGFKPAFNSASKDKKPKVKSKLSPELRDKEEKAAQRYGVQITAEDALEFTEAIKGENVKDLSFDQIRAQNIKKSDIKIENHHKFIKPTSSVAKEISIEGDLTLAELARKLAIKKDKLLRQLKKLGANPDEKGIIDKETAVLVSEELDYNVETPLSTEEAFQETYSLPEDAKYEARPPIVTVMGHVDHGKTTLLDYIRKSNQADSEAGKITQHFGAYSVTLDNDKITFFDTPGHAAFSDMRARGAKLTDIVVLVVAADDGMKPQTVEAIKHAQAANTPIIVAINKMDAEGADAEQARKDISGYGLHPEEWGGDVQFVEISAKSGEGVDKLLKSIVAQTSVMELKAALNVPGRGHVIESNLDKNIGPSATVILQHGNINSGDIVLVGSYYGKIKIMKDDTGVQIKSAGPSTPVNILGLNGVPQAGDVLMVVSNEKEARRMAEIAESHNDITKGKPLVADIDVTELLESTEPEMRKLNLIIKTDVTGSLEAIRSMIADIKSEQAEFNLVSFGVGAISATDVSLASATGATIIGFNVRLDPAAKQAIKQPPIPELHYFNVIYELADQLNKALTEDAVLQDVDKILGIAVVKDVFSAKRFGQIAGCEVSEGIIYKDKPIRVLRDDKVIYEGVLESLRRFKENVKEVHKGIECGIGVKDYKNVKAGDQIEVYDRVAGSPS